MTFTKDTPTTPGFYAWRLFSHDIPSLQLVREGKYPAANGEWCRLVPAEELRFAWGEGRGTVFSSAGIDIDWNNSRTKRVMDGKE